MYYVDVASGDHETESEIWDCKSSWYSLRQWRRGLRNRSHTRDRKTFKIIALRNYIFVIRTRFQFVKRILNSLRTIAIPSRYRRVDDR